MTMDSLLQRLMGLQEKEADLIEKDEYTLEDIREYWDTIRAIQTILAAAAAKGVKYIGLQRVPPAHVAEAQAKDAILMSLLVSSIATSSFKDLPFSLHDWMPSTYRRPPEGIKLGATPVRVVYNDDPDTETEYIKWRDILVHDPITGGWSKGSGGVDNVGLYVTVDGRQIYYVYFHDAAQVHTPAGQVPTWRIRGEDQPDLSLPPPDLSPPQHESTRVGESPSPPQLTRISGGPERRRSSTRPTRAPKRRTHTTQRPTRTPAEGVAPGEVGTVRHTTQKAGGTRVQQLIQDARDPPGLCFEGKTSQLKTIRARVCGGDYPYDRVSSTWRWLGKDGEDKSKIIVLFKDSKQRDSFEKAFYTGAAGVRVFHVSLSGL